MAPATVVSQVTDVIEAAVALRAGVAFSDGFGLGEMDAAHMRIQLPLREEAKVARGAAKHPGGNFRAVEYFVVFHPGQVLAPMRPFDVLVKVGELCESHRAMRAGQNLRGGSCGNGKR